MKQQPNTLVSQNKTVNQTQIKISFSESNNRNPPISTLPFTCKICLSQVPSTQVQHQGLIAPCECTGTMKYVHEVCLVEWLNMTVKKNLQKGQNTYNIYCQICKIPYQYQIFKETVCAPKQQIKQKIGLNWSILALGVIFILGSLGGIIFLAYLAISGKIQSSSSDYPILLVAIVLLVVVIVLWIARLIYLFLLKKLNFIKSVKKSHNPQPLRFNPESSLNQINQGIHKWK